MTGEAHCRSFSEEVAKVARFYTYDSPEAIQKCLNCPKPECTNCLGYIFFDPAEDDENDDDMED